MPQLGSRAKQRCGREFFLGTLALLVVASVVIGATYYAIARPKGLDPRTMCPADGPAGHYVILVDKTDPLTFIQSQAFTVVFRDVIEKRVPEGYLLSVFVLGDHFQQNAAPLVEICNPGKGVGRSELTSNLTKLRKQYENKFIEPLLGHFGDLFSPRPSDISPIFEMLQLVGLNGFQKHDVPGERRLLIVSDMLQNTPQLSMYKGPVDYAAFAPTDYAKRTQPDLRGVKVELYYLMNKPQIQTRRNLQFWEDFFEKAGARVDLVRPMEG